MRALAVLALSLSIPTAQAQDKVVLQLSWDHQSGFAGYYAALWQGFYADEGIDEEIRSAFSPNGRVQAVTEVAAGRADFGIGAADVLVAINGGAPLLIASPVLQQSGRGVISRQESGISSPADLSGLKVATPISSVGAAEFNAMLGAEGVDPDTIEWAEIGPGQGAQALADGAVDAMFSFWPAMKWQLSDLGISATFLPPSTYGVDFYGASVFTSRRLADQNPDFVRRFVEASLEGWQYALSHGNEVAGRISQDFDRIVPVPNLKLFNQSMMVETAALTLRPAVEFGHSNPARWAAMFDILTQAGLVAGEFIYSNYIFDPERQGAVARGNFLMRLAFGSVVGIVLAIAASVLTWSWTLRRQVAARTNELVERDRELSESEARYALAVSGSNAGIFEWNIETGKVYRSPRYLAMLGYGQDELDSVPEAFFEILHPEDVERLKTSMNRHIKDKPRHDVEVRMRHKDGHYIWGHITGQASWDKNGQARIFAGSVIDITERRKIENALRSSEERFALAVVGTDAGLWDWDSATESSYRSPRLHEMFGYLPDEIPAAGDAFYTMIHPDDAEKFHSAMQAHIDDRVLFDIEIRVRHKDGHYVWVHERGQAVWDENGNVQRMVGSITDISSRLEARRAL